MSTGLLYLAMMMVGALRDAKTIEKGPTFAVGGPPPPASRRCAQRPMTKPPLERPRMEIPGNPLGRFGGSRRFCCRRLAHRGARCTGSGCLLVKQLLRPSRLLPIIAVEFSTCRLLWAHADEESDAGGEGGGCVG